MKKLLVLLPALLAAAPASPCGATSGTCVCSPPQSAKWGLESADVVFRGVVTKIEFTFPGPSGSPSTEHAKFHVIEQWKGASADTISVYHSLSDCGYRFQPGVEYLIYADDEASYLTASICNRTMKMTEKEADEDVRELRRLAAVAR
jgi:hypothetical protein